MKKVFVTGSARGIGLAVTESLAAHGYDIVAITRAQCDVADPRSVQEYFRPYANDKDAWGLVHCAGIARTELACSTHSDHMKSIIGTNLLGTIYTNKYFGQIATRRKAGRIVNLSSISAHLPIAGEAVYGASKGGVETFSRTFAREMAPFGVAVNCVAPGPVDTDMTRQISPEKLDAVVRQQIIQRKATVQEVALIVRWLLAEPTGMVTGQVINVGGV